MVCLESDFIVSFLREKPAAIQKIQQLIGANIPICVSPLTAAELFEGAFSSDSENEIAKVEELLSTMKMLDFDLLAAKKAGEILALLSKKGEKIGDIDSMTAAIALRHGQELITKNERHFAKIKNLKISSW